MTMQTDTLATIYARSLYELAEESGGRDMVLELADELEQVIELLASEHSLDALFSSPVIDTDRRSTTIRTIFELRVTDLLLRFMLILNANGRLGHLGLIQVAYDQLVQDAFGRIEVDVITASPIDEATLARIGERIKAAMGKDPVLHPSTSPAIIGGIQLRIGDELLDGSVATKLRKMGTNLREKGSRTIRSSIGTYLGDTT